MYERISKSSMEKMLLEFPQYRRYLFQKGFLLTDAQTNFVMDNYPFYCNWKKITFNNYQLLVHNEENFYIKTDESASIVLIGHAVDAVNAKYSEDVIIADLLYQWKNKQYDAFWNRESGLTGIYLLIIADDEGIHFSVDCAGMQYSHYGIVGKNIYISSHSILVADLCNLSVDKYISRLINYKLSKLYGNWLPADSSPYKELKRVQPNCQYTYSSEKVSFDRIYPKEKIVPVESESDYNHIVNQCAAILHSSLDLYSQKWPNRVAISVTGGKDSLTTLACANGLYEKLKYFSYDSCPQERIDALAAKQVCDSLHLPHSFYEIEGEAQLEGYEQFNMLLEYNLGCTGPVKLNNVNKRIFFSNCSDFDIEVKSWVDEIGRARYHKRFAKRKLPQKMRARYCTCLYKIFITNRRLLRETDQVFKKYITKYYDSDVLNKIPWYDLFYWEFSFGAGDAFFLRAEHRMSYDIAIPFNNRRLVDLMLHVPLSYRIEDRIQKDIIRMRNDQIEKTGVSVVDANYTTLRTLFERVYLEINSRLPF